MLYKNLSDRVRPDAANFSKAVWEEYFCAVRVLTRHAKDPQAWLRNWTVAVEKTITHDLINADKLWTSINNFMKVIGQWKPAWVTAYSAQYKQEMKAGTLSFRTVASDFEE